MKRVSNLNTFHKAHRRICGIHSAPNDAPCHRKIAQALLLLADPKLAVALCIGIAIDNTPMLCNRLLIERTVSMQRLFFAVIITACLFVALTARAENERRVLQIESPLDFQVFQRETAAGGHIRVAGSASPSADVKVLIEGAGLREELPHHWHRLNPDRSTGAFRADLPVPAGGFFKVTIVSSAHGSKKEREIVPHVGVGEVFVIAGQSNSTNYGEEPQKVTSGLVSTFDGKTWRIADDPQPGTQDDSKKGSFAPAFGDAMVARYHVPIGIASVGHGSTSVRQWLPAGTPVLVMPTMTKFITRTDDGTLVSDGTLYNGLLKRIHQLGPHGFRALLWHQGESDTHQPPEHEIPPATYAQMMTQLIESARRDAGWDFPWFVALASYHSPSDPSSASLRDAQRSLWQSGIALEGPDTDTLTGNNRQNGGKGVHLSAQGLQAHGKMWAAKVSVYLDPLLSESTQMTK